MRRPGSRAVSGAGTGSEAGAVVVGGSAGAAPAALPPPATPPARVVSMNLCTDQLAMALAAPGQLISVSYIARDPRASAMAEEALADLPARLSGLG
mgnify:CR=1 FL=1